MKSMSRIIFLVTIVILCAKIVSSKKIDTSCDFDTYDISSLEKKDSFVFTSHKNFGKKPYGKKEKCGAVFKVSFHRGYSMQKTFYSFSV